MSKMQYQFFTVSTKWILSAGKLLQFEFSRKQMPRQRESSARDLCGGKPVKETGKRKQERAGKSISPQSRCNTCERREERKEVWVGGVSDGSTVPRKSWPACGDLWCADCTRMEVSCFEQRRLSPRLPALQLLTASWGEHSLSLDTEASPACTVAVAAMDNCALHGHFAL